MEKTFVELMADAQTMHLHRDYETSLALHVQALEVAPDNLAKGRAIRDMAADSDRLDKPVDAMEYAAAAYTLHDAEVKASTPGALRERAASGMYVGSLLLRKAIRLEQTDKNSSVWSTGLESRDYLAAALEDIAEIEKKQGGIIDQYRINMTGRAAIAEALYGERLRALKLGARAVSLAPLSETAATSTYNLAMPKKDKFYARAVALARGVSALAVTALSFKPTRLLALRLSDKTL